LCLCPIILPVRASLDFYVVATVADAAVMEMVVAAAVVVVGEVGEVVNVSKRRQCPSFSQPLHSPFRSCMTQSTPYPLPKALGLRSSCRPL
jgi:hypothetical protein